MQNILIIMIVFLGTFTFQSLFILLFPRSIMMKLLPLAVFAVPLTGIWTVVSESPALYTQAVYSRLDMLIPIILGDILGWILGFRFRKIIDQEYKEMMAKYDRDFENDDDQAD